MRTSQKLTAKRQEGNPRNVIWARTAQVRKIPKDSEFIDHVAENWTYKVSLSEKRGSVALQIRAS